MSQEPTRNYDPWQQLLKSTAAFSFFLSCFVAAKLKFLQLIDRNLSVSSATIMIYFGKIKNIEKVGCRQSQVFWLAVIVIVITTIYERKKPRNLQSPYYLYDPNY